MNEAKFLDGLIFKLPNENAPDFVKGRISIKREELIEALKAETGDWINLDLKVSKEGKPYAQVDTWKPDTEKVNEVSDDLPF